MMDKLEELAYYFLGRLSAVINVERAKIQQVLKAFVYLAMAGTCYLFATREIHAVMMTGTPRSLYEYGAFFPVSLQMIGWVGLLVGFELETFVLKDPSKWTRRAMTGIRILSYVFILASLNFTIDYLQWSKEIITLPMEETSLCEILLSQEDIMFTINWRPIVVDTVNCLTLGSGTEWFESGAGLITDREGIYREISVGYFDTFETITWLLIMWAYEIQTQILDRGLDRPKLMRYTNHVVNWGYAAILFLLIPGVFYLGEFLWVTNEIIFVFGWLFIGINLHEWDDWVHSEKAEAAGEGLESPLNA